MSSNSTRDEGGYTTFEIFIRWKAGDPFEHVGDIESPSHDTALLAAKEHFARRDRIAEMWAVARHDVRAATWDRRVLDAGPAKRYRRSLGAVKNTADILTERI